MPGAQAAGKLQKACDSGQTSHPDHITSPTPLPSRARIQASEEPLGQSCGAQGPLCGAMAEDGVGMRAQGEREEGLRIPSNPSWAERTWQGQPAWTDSAWWGVGSSWEERDRWQLVLRFNAKADVSLTPTCCCINSCVSVFP